MELGVIAIKAYFTLTRSLEQEPYHQIQFNIIPRHFFAGVSTLCLGCSRRIASLIDWAIYFLETLHQTSLKLRRLLPKQCLLLAYIDTTIYKEHNNIAG